MIFKKMMVVSFFCGFMSLHGMESEQPVAPVRYSIDDIVHKYNNGLIQLQQDNGSLCYNNAYHYLQSKYLCAYNAATNMLFLVVLSDAKRIVKNQEGLYEAYDQVKHGDLFWINEDWKKLVTGLNSCRQAGEALTL